MTVGDVVEGVEENGAERTHNVVRPVAAKGKEARTQENANSEVIACRVEDSQAWLVAVLAAFLEHGHGLLYFGQKENSSRSPNSSTMKIGPTITQTRGFLYKIMTNQIFSSTLDPLCPFEIVMSDHIPDHILSITQELSEISTQLGFFFMKSFIPLVRIFTLVQGSDPISVSWFPVPRRVQTQGGDYHKARGVCEYFYHGVEGLGRDHAERTCVCVPHHRMARGIDWENSVLCLGSAIVFVLFQKRGKNVFEETNCVPDWRRNSEGRT